MTVWCTGEYIDLLTSAENLTCRTLTNHLRLLPVGGLPVCQTVILLFDDLRASLTAERQVDVGKSVRRFFDDLFALVVRRHVLRQASVDAHHAACVRSLRRGLLPDPLDGVDNRFTEIVLRALNSSQILLDALRLAVSTLSTATQHWVKSSTSCRRALTRLQLCAVCDGHTDWRSLRPCRGLCVNVARGCLSALTVQLGPRWERFVDGLAGLVARTRGPRDLELVSKSLDGTVADAVLRVIRNAPHFYAQVDLHA